MCNRTGSSTSDAKCAASTSEFDAFAIGEMRGLQSMFQGGNRLPEVGIRARSTVDCRQSVPNWNINFFIYQLAIVYIETIYNKWFPHPARCADGSPPRALM